jgi:hypothetical protein
MLAPYVPRGGGALGISLVVFLFVLNWFLVRRERRRAAASAPFRPPTGDTLPASEEERIDAYAGYFRHLDEAHESGANMLDLAPFLQYDYGLSEREANEVLAKWTGTFDGESAPRKRAETALRPGG